MPGERRVDELAEKLWSLETRRQKEKTKMFKQLSLVGKRDVLYIYMFKIGIR